MIKIGFQHIGDLSPTITESMRKDLNIDLENHSGDLLSNLNEFTSKDLYCLANHNAKIERFYFSTFHYISSTVIYDYL